MAVPCGKSESYPYRIVHKGRHLLLADEAGEPLPNQRLLVISNDMEGQTFATVEFILTELHLVPEGECGGCKK